MPNHNHIPTLQNLLGYPWEAGLLTSLLVISAVMLLRYLVVRFIRGKTEILDYEQRRWINRINNFTTVLLLLVLMTIWAPQIRTLALSLTAVAVAVVLTTKELLMCLTGGFLQASTKSFEVGDWITINGITGEVMRIGAMTTTIEQLDEHYYTFTGETVQIPNSQFLTANLQNNHLKQYHYTRLVITIPAPADSALLKQKLQNIVDGVYADYQAGATLQNRQVEKLTGVDYPDTDPVVLLQTTDVGHYQFVIRLYIPTLHTAQIESDITTRFTSMAFRHNSSLDQPQ